MSGSGFPVCWCERELPCSHWVLVWGEEIPVWLCWDSLKLPLLGFLTCCSHFFSVWYVLVSVPGHTGTAQLTALLWFSWGRELACLPWVCYPHGTCPCLCRKVLCLPCRAEFSLPWLILHCWLQHWCRLGSQEWSPFPQQILLSHHFMKKTKILSIFSHPSTLKSMPILRAAVFRLLQSVPSHCPCLSQGLGSVKPLRSRKKHSSIHSEAGLGLVWPYSPTGKWSATKCMKEPVLELCCVSLWNKKKCQLNFTFQKQIFTYSWVLLVCSCYLFTDQSQTCKIPNHTQ